MTTVLIFDQQTAATKIKSRSYLLQERKGNAKLWDHMPGRETSSFLFTVWTMNGKRKTNMENTDTLAQVQRVIRYAREIQNAKE